jgi:type IV secretory pathway TraG/TraD family ATPase VirD4
MSGLPIGDLIDPSPPSRWRALCGLFDPRRPSGEAVGDVLRAFVRGFETRVPLRLNRSVHTLTIAPPGAGKSTGLIVPFLRECRDSMVVNDIKGELYALTASHRRAMGHTVLALDPWRLVTSSPETLNPFDLEDP